jgi:hypothetical protein
VRREDWYAATRRGGQRALTLAPSRFSRMEVSTSRRHVTLLT